MPPYLRFDITHLTPTTIYIQIVSKIQDFYYITPQIPKGLKSVLLVFIYYLTFLRIDLSFSVKLQT